MAKSLIYKGFNIHLSDIMSVVVVVTPTGCYFAAHHFIRKCPTLVSVYSSQYFWDILEIHG